MTIRELIAKLEKLPEDLEVHVGVERWCSSPPYGYGPVTITSPIVAIQTERAAFGGSVLLRGKPHQRPGL